MKRLKENLTNILLIITIIVCTVCICNKIDENNNKDILNKIESSLEYKASESTLRRIEWELNDVNKYLKNIDLSLDGWLDDILYYMPKAR